MSLSVIVVVKNSWLCIRGIVKAWVGIKCHVCVCVCLTFVISSVKKKHSLSTVSGLVNISQSKSTTHIFNEHVIHI